MFSSILDIITDLSGSIIDALSEDGLFFVVAGINLLLGLVLLFGAMSSFGKTTKKLKTAIAAGKPAEEDVHLLMMPRSGASPFAALAVFVFAFAFLICVFAVDLIIVPAIGLLIFELFNFLSRLIYNGKFKKTKKLLEVYQGEFAGQSSTAEYKTEPKARDKEEPETQDVAHVEPMTTTTVIMTGTPASEHETKTATRTEPTTAPVTVSPVTVTMEPARPVTAEPIKTVTTEPAPRPVVDVKTAPEQPVEKPAAEKKTEPAGYQPYETRRPVTQPEYNIERAPTYQVPRPPVNPPVVDIPKSAPEVKAEPKPEPKPVTPKDPNSYTIDDIVERINQIKRDGATKQAMTELIYIIQKEREKNENKNPAERQRLSEALSELLKAMNKAQ